MICTMVERITSNWAVLTKAESLGREAVACGAIGIAGVGVGSVRIVVWITGARKIHWAASKIASIECGSDGKWCGYLICRWRSIWDWRMASKARRYCWDCCGTRGSLARLGTTRSCCIEGGTCRDLVAIEYHSGHGRKRGAQGRGSYIGR